MDNNFRNHVLPTVLGGVSKAFIITIIEHTIVN